jgi:hypothetical protein
MPKERPEYRTHRKALPEMVEVTQKNKVIKEIFTTEASYVDDLSVAIKVRNFYIIILFNLLLPFGMK